MVKSRSNTWGTGWIVMLATVRRVRPWTVRFILDGGARTFGMGARLVGRDRPRGVHQYVTHVRHMWPVRAGRRIAAGRLRERL